MRGIVEVARREVVMRRAILVAAAVASLVPLAVPWLRGLSGANAADARSWTALILSAAFSVGIAAGLGLSMLAPAIAGRSLAFDLSRPLSAFAIWTGRVAAACLIASASAILLWIPAWAAGAAVPWRDLVDLPELPSSWPLLTLGLLAVIFAACHALSVMFRSGSARVALDLALAVAAAFAASAALAQLPRFAAQGAFERAATALALLTAIGLLASGYASVAGGRTDIRAAHRSLSLVLWTVIAAAVAGIHVYARWVVTATPADLAGITSATPAPDGTWTVVSGPARGAEATFLYDTASGRFQRTLVRDWVTPVFSADGRRAAWVEGRDQGGPLPLWIWDLADRDAVPVRTRLELNGYPSLTVLSDDGSRLATVERGVLSIHDLAASRTLASARAASEDAYLRGFFASSDVVRLFRNSEIAPETTRLEILEFDVASRRLRETGSFSMASGWYYLAADRGGDRLIVVQTQTKEVWLLDGRSGRLLSTVAQALPGRNRWPGFLADGRFVLTDSSSAGKALHVFSRDGAPTRIVLFPGAAGLVPGGEVAPGKLVIAIGDGPLRRIELVDVDTGERRPVADDLFPAARLSAPWNQPNAAPAVGSNATKLFYRIDESLIRLDPATGERRVLLGKGAR